jgi:L-lactate utilization protein LutC
MNYTTIPPLETVNKTGVSLKERNFEPIVVNTKEEAFEKIKELIPAGASVMNGTSETLKQIGFIDYLKKNEHGWNNLHEDIVKEADPVKQGELRRQALLSEYYIGSVHAIAETGELVIASNSGSQLPHIVYSSPNIIFVASTNKITPNLDTALKRLHEHVVPLENKRMMEAMGMGTYLSKLFIFFKEQEYTGRNIKIILVNEPLGF